MTTETISNPIEFVEKLGSLHDVFVRGFQLDVGNEALTMVIEDLNANFTGLPEDPGRRPCRLLFQGVQALTMNLVFADKSIAISAAKVFDDPPHFRLEMDLRFGGRGGGRSVAVAFRSLQIVDI